LNTWGVNHCILKLSLAFLLQKPLYSKTVKIHKSILQCSLNWYYRYRKRAETMNFRKKKSSGWAWTNSACASFTWIKIFAKYLSEQRTGIRLKTWPWEEPDVWGVGSLTLSFLDCHEKHVLVIKWCTQGAPVRA